jgi:NTP pyrophosphatase (non-canonical NTP hydrolase)
MSGMTGQQREDTLTALGKALRDFAQARNWEQFHTPRNLATALSVEAAELLEHFQWLQDREVAAFDAPKRERIGEEMADVLLYLVRLADRLELDLAAAAWRKLEINARKYPVALARGNSTKYTEFGQGQDAPTRG